ncbi:hypothetical protein FB451DRAFT_171430 [Mycena latifolia]|nr:hypothetical protein FB451DRAFT_171430 [Mycena latifolia]
MAPSHSPSIRLINRADPPRCPLPAVLGPAKQAACFSICDEHLEIDSTSALRYFAPPPLGANLRDGVEQFMERPLEDRAFQYARRLDTVFTTCLHSENSEELLKAEVVTWRGIMTKIMLGYTLDLNISYHKGVLYLEEHREGEKFDQDSERTFVGYKFEAICTTSTPGGERSDGTDVDLHTLWNTAITRTLGSLRILLVGEVDCVKPGYSEHPGPEHYVELKTKKKERVYNIAHAKWNMQSYLLDTPQIFVGFLDGADIVRDFATFSVQHMESQQYRIDWGARVLHSLRAHCARSGNNKGVLKVWRVQAKKKEVRLLNKEGAPRNGIIPVSFIQELESRMSAV